MWLLLVLSAFPVLVSIGSTEIAGTLAVMGGYTIAGGAQRAVYGFDVYDGLVVKTIDGADMPYYAWYQGHTQRGNELYLVGGRNSGVPGHMPGDSGTSCFKYHYGMWTTLPLLPMPRKRPCTFVIQDVLYAAGGIQDPQYHMDIQAMDLNVRELKWETAPAIYPFPMQDERCSTIGDRVYVTYAHYLLTWTPGSGWVALMNMPESRRGHCMVSDDVDRLWVLGGEDSITVAMYNTTQYRWTMMSPLPVKSTRLTGHSCVYHDGWIYIVGGVAAAGDGYNNAIYAYDVTRDEWRSYEGVLPPPGLTQMAVGIVSWG